MIDHCSKAMVGALALAAVMGVAGPAGAQEKPKADVARKAEAAPIALRAGAVAGSIVALDGKTPVAGARVVLFDAEGREIASAVSGVEGRFDLGAKPVGKYRLEVGKAAGTIQLADTAKATSLRLVLPAEIAKGIKAAGEGGAGAAENTVTLLGMEFAEDLVATAGTIVVVGAGAGAGAVIVGEELGQSERAEDRRDALKASASPTQP
jgi:hypothetical protein